MKTKANNRTETNPATPLQLQLRANWRGVVYHTQRARYRAVFAHYISASGPLVWTVKQ